MCTGIIFKRITNTMQYLEDLQHYEDRYDLWTIEQCLRHVEILKKVAAKIHNKQKLRHLSPDEKDHQLNMLANQILLSVMLDRYADRETTLKKWTDEDRRKQELQDLTPPPQNIICEKCGEVMHCTMRHLYSDSETDDRVLFFFTCGDCKAREAVFENGEVWKRKPDQCKCGGELQHNFKQDGHFEIWETTCTKCHYQKVNKTDQVKRKQKRKQQAARERELLNKYRSMFCLEKKRAEESLDVRDEMKFAGEVYEYELKTRNIPEYEQKHNLQKLSVVELEEMLKKELRKQGFRRLLIGEPEIGRYVEVNFTVLDYTRTKSTKDSTNMLDDLLRGLLKSTNWRVVERVSSRLGFLTTRLRGYERDEDILSMLMKNKTRPKSSVMLDPEKLAKYDQSSAVKLARISAEYEVRRRINMKRYQQEPDGFILESDGEKSYSCNSCGRSIAGNETWWLPEAILCLDCNRNLKEGIFPVEIFENHKLYFRIWDVEQEFGMYSATVRKHIRNGDLVARELKTAEGKTYDRILMSEDNVEFFKTHPRKREHEQRWHYVDGEGRVVWL